jgi:hypothetical protein
MAISRQRLAGAACEIESRQDWRLTSRVGAASGLAAVEAVGGRRHFVTRCNRRPLIRPQNLERLRRKRRW